MSTNPFQQWFNAAQIYSCATLSLSNTHTHTHTHNPTHQEWRSIMNEYQSFSLLIQRRTDLFVCNSPKKLPGIWMSHGAYENESFRAYECVVSLIWMSHVAHMNESCRTYAWVTSYIWTRHVPRESGACRIYNCVMSHIRMIHVAQVAKLRTKRSVSSDSKS